MAGGRFPDGSRSIDLPRIGEEGSGGTGRWVSAAAATPPRHGSCRSGAVRNPAGRFPSAARGRAQGGACPRAKGVRGGRGVQRLRQHPDAGRTGLHAPGLRPGAHQCERRDACRAHRGGGVPADVLRRPGLGAPADDGADRASAELRGLGRRAGRLVPGQPAPPPAKPGPAGARPGCGSLVPRQPTCAHVLRCSLGAGIHRGDLPDPPLARRARGGRHADHPGAGAAVGMGLAGGVPQRLGALGGLTPRCGGEPAQRGRAGGDGDVRALPAPMEGPARPGGGFPGAGRRAAGRPAVRLQGVPPRSAGRGPGAGGVAGASPGDHAGDDDRRRHRPEPGARAGRAGDFGVAGVHRGTPGVGPPQRVAGALAARPERGAEPAPPHRPAGGGGRDRGAARGGQAGAARGEFRAGARHGGGADRPERQRQEHAGAAGRGGVACADGRGAPRWRGGRRLAAAEPVPACRLHAAGGRAVRGQRGGERRAAGGAGRRGGDRRSARRALPRDDHAHAGQLRSAGGAGRGQPLGGPAPEGGAGAGVVRGPGTGGAGRAGCEPGCGRRACLGRGSPRAGGAARDRADRDPQRPAAAPDGAGDGAEGRSAGEGGRA